MLEFEALATVDGIITSTVEVGTSAKFQFAGEDQSVVELPVHVLAQALLIDELLKHLGKSK